MRLMTRGINWNRRPHVRVRSERTAQLRAKGDLGTLEGAEPFVERERQQPSYIVHHAVDDRPRVISRLPWGMARWEFDSNPDQYQFTVGTCYKDRTTRGYYMVELNGHACPVDLYGTRFRAKRMIDLKSILREMNA